MHRELKDHLHSAEGESQHVLVTFLDVRGFSSFARIAESSDSAEFLKSAYLRILDDYFPKADFFKPTGDGLLILRRYERESLTEATREAVETSIKLVKDFPSITENDPMVNFEVPGELGVGLARGAATAIISGEKTLDYTGRPLNLAARLMDLARPAGVVFDDTLGVDLLTAAIQEQFSKEEVYVKGIAEDDPIAVYYLKGCTDIPDYNKAPMNRLTQFTEAKETLSLKELEERANYLHPLTHEPAKRDEIIAHLRYPDVRKDKSKHPSLYRFHEVKAEFKTARGNNYARVFYGPVVQKLKSFGVKPPWEVEVVIEYPIRKA
jgi:class 3 adenylate cyclase